MKFYVKSATDLNEFPTRGSAPHASAESSGLIKFNAGRHILLDNGVRIYLSTGKIMVNSRTGDIVVSMNVSVTTPAKRDGAASIEFYGYSPEEFKQLYQYLDDMSTDEANIRIKNYSDEILDEFDDEE